MANYLLGGVLRDPDINLATGKDRIRAQIKARTGVTPYGIVPSQGYHDRQDLVKTHDFWSRPHELMESQRCPYYDKGNCTVWKYRENLCVTYFCSSIGGTSGQAFWKKLNKYIKMAETSLSQYAMLQCGWSPTALQTKWVSTSDVDLEDENGKVDDSRYSKLWGEWEGREEEFYLQCYDVVKLTSAATFKSITGLTREILDAALRDTQQKFQEGIFPDYLLLHPDIKAEKISEGLTRIELNNVSAEIPSVLYPLVRGFNGNRTTVEVFHLGYNVLISLNHVVEDLLQKGLLIIPAAKIVNSN
jgi:Fe-S-cluster containining protein